MVMPGVSRDTKIVSWLGATICVTIWRSRVAIQTCDTIAACYDTACDTVGRTRDTTRSARCRSCIATWFSMSRWGGCDMAGPDAATLRAKARVRAAIRQGTTMTRPDICVTQPGRGPLYDPARAP